MKERIEARDSEEKVWVKSRKEAWDRGYAAGVELIETMGMREATPETPNARYLYYLHRQGFAQALTNLAREVGQTNFGRTQEEAQNKNRVPS